MAALSERPDGWYMAAVPPGFGRLILRCTSLGFLGGIFFSYRLWWESDFFPNLPVLKFGHSEVLEKILATTLVMALLGVIMTAKRVVIGIIFLSVLTLLVLDQMRWQPWVFLYLLLLLPQLYCEDDHATIIYWRLVVAGVYFWSGVHKINPHFVTGDYQVALEFFFDQSFSPPQGIARWLAYAVGIFESFIGIGLLFRTTRVWALCAVVAMHLFIVIYVLLQEPAYDVIVVPWNVIMIILDIMLFGKFTTGSFDVIKLKWKWWNLRMPTLIILNVGILLAWIAPAFNLIGRWDHLLSFSLYSGKVPNYYVAVRDDEFEKIPVEIRRHVISIPGVVGGQIIDVDRWAHHELHVPFYPETRTFRLLADFFCEMDMDKEGLVFLEIRKVRATKEVIRFTCDAPDETIGWY